MRVSEGEDQFCRSGGSLLPAVPVEVQKCRSAEGHRNATANSSTRYTDNKQHAQKVSRSRLEWRSMTDTEIFTP